MNNVLSIDKNDNNNKQILSNNFISEQRLKYGKEENKIKKTFSTLSNNPFNLQNIIDSNKEKSLFKKISNSLIIKKDSISSYNSITLKKNEKIYHLNYNNKIIKNIGKIFNSIMITSKDKNNEFFDLENNINNISNTNIIDLSSKSRFFQTYIPISPLKCLIKRNYDNINCIICNNYFDSNEKIVVLNKCYHILCKYCFKIYFESEIEKGKSNLNCPLYRCNSEVNIELIKKNISKNYFDLFLQNIEKKKFIKQNTKFTTYDNILNKKDIILDKFQKHFFEITNDSEIYYSLNKVKNQYCPNCGIRKLFSVPQWNIIKCLNCLKWYCKFCFKEVDNDHFNKFSDKYCRVYSMKNTIIIGRKKKLYQSRKISDLIIKIGGGLIIGYFMLFFGMIFNFFSNFKQRKYNFIFIDIIIYGIIFIIYIIFLIIIFLLLIPYFPIVNCLMDFILDD